MRFATVGIAMMASVALLAGMVDAHVYLWQAPMTVCPAECQGPLCPDLCSPTCANEWDEPRRWVLEVCETGFCDYCAYDTFPDDATDDATITFNNTTIGSFTMQLTTWLIDVLTIETGAANSNGYTLTFESTMTTDTLTPDYVSIVAKYATITVVVRDGARIVTD